MALLGFLILVFVALVALIALFRGTDTVRIDVNAFTIESTAGQVFAAGALSVALVVLGVWLLRRGVRKSRARRSEMQGLRKRAAAGDKAVEREESQHTEPGDGRDDGPDQAYESTPRDR
jgi:hypothetical protein